MKYFVSNAPACGPIERLLHVAFSRWHVERCFQDENVQLGLDQFECRRYVAVQLHLILTAISHLLLTRLRLKLISEGQGAGGKILTVQQVRRAVDASIEAATLTPHVRRNRLRRTVELIARVQVRNAKARRSHHQCRIDRLHALGINLKTCRCCIPPETKPALSC